MDEIIRAVSKDGFVKISVVTARDAVQRANAIHHCSPTAIAALGRSLCAASMLGDLLKEEMPMTLDASAILHIFIMFMFKLWIKYVWK